MKRIRQVLHFPRIDLHERHRGYVGTCIVQAQTLLVDAGLKHGAHTGGHHRGLVEELTGVVPKLIFFCPSSPKSPLIFMGMISWGFMVILVMKDRKFWGFRDDELVGRSPWGLLLGHPIYYLKKKKRFFGGKST